MHAARRPRGARPSLVAIIVAIFTLQILVPAVALVAPDKPNRLGWQMYSGLGDDDVSVVDQEGSVIQIPWEEILAAPRRNELDWTRYFPERLCDHVAADEIRVSHGSRERSVAC